MNGKLHRFTFLILLNVVATLVTHTEGLTAATLMWKLLVQWVFSHLCSLFELLFCAIKHYLVNFFISTMAYPGLTPTCQLPDNKENLNSCYGSPLVKVQLCVVGATETHLGAVWGKRGKDCHEKMSLVLQLIDFVVIHIALHNARHYLQG